MHELFERARGRAPCILFIDDLESVALQRGGPRSDDITTLEIVNHGPFELRVRPKETRLCQLIIEEVKGVPKRGGSAAFSQQATPLGTPRRRSQEQ